LHLKYTTDIPENQVLKAALMLSRRFILEFFGNSAKEKSMYTAAISLCSHALKNV
jgi:hypothetical protein